MTNILSNLHADTATATVNPTPDILRQVHNGVHGGQFRTLNLGPEGLFFKRGSVITALIPLDELWKLEETVVPARKKPK